MRNDYGLGYMLNWEHIAWYENGEVRILDRRVYPSRVRFEICRTVDQVASAIKEMVTQSEGPYLAAAMGMALAAHISDDLSSLEQASYTLSHARPTTTCQMERITRGAVERAKSCGKRGEELAHELFLYAIGYVSGNYRRYTQIGEALASLVPDSGRVLTHCFGGTVVGTFLRACREQHKSVELFCCETRPYWQGARLTASVASEIGVPVTVICDSMAAVTMQERGIDLFFTASDVITQDGHIINKVGTFQIALAAKALGVPYYVTGTPDPDHEGIEGVVVEQRDPESVVTVNGTRIVKPGVKGYYPAFDITPPELCTGVITQKGVFSPYELDRYFS